MKNAFVYKEGGAGFIKYIAAHMKLPDVLVVPQGSTMKLVLTVLLGPFQVVDPRFYYRGSNLTTLH